jgi:histone H3/H4
MFYLAFSLTAARTTVTPLDVIYALKRNGMTLYGFGA